MCSSLCSPAIRFVIQAIINRHYAYRVPRTRVPGYTLFFVCIRLMCVTEFFFWAYACIITTASGQYHARHGLPSSLAGEQSPGETDLSLGWLAVRRGYRRARFGNRRTWHRRRQGQIFLDPPLHKLPYQSRCRTFSWWRCPNSAGIWVVQRNFCLVISPILSQIFNTLI